VHRPERKSLAARSVTIAGVVLLLFALGGGAVLSLLRVSLPAFRVAGGVLLFLQALTLTFSNPGLSSINASETRDAQGAGDIAIFPLAFPVIAQVKKERRRQQQWDQQIIERVGAKLPFVISKGIGIDEERYSYAKQRAANG
jgi:MarC family integral membrane protein